VDKLGGYRDCYSQKRRSFRQGVSKDHCCSVELQCRISGHRPEEPKKTTAFESAFFQKRLS